MPPVDDDHPYRLTPQRASIRAQFYASFASTAANRRRFAESAVVRALWPDALRERSLPYFGPQSVINRQAWSAYGAGQLGVADA